jgi:hypothetical protein
MKALTLIQPWAWAICHAGKRIENRGWRPPRSLWGERIAIHAGKSLDEEACVGLYLSGYSMPASVPQSVIVATARVLGIVTEDKEKPGAFTFECLRERPQWAMSPKNLVWFCGPVGWLLDEVVVLREPVACKGAQRLWTVPAEVERQVLGMQEAG